MYNETKVGDVTEVFREMKPIDLIIAADSYIYFGDLNPLFQSMNEGLTQGGYVAFTLENPSEEYQERYVFHLSKSLSEDYKHLTEKYI